MTRAQKIVVVIGLLVLGLMLAFPPWDSYRTSTGERIGFVEYSLFTDPPKGDVFEDVRMDPQGREFIIAVEYRISEQRLIIQVLIALVATVLLVVLFTPRSNP